MFQKLKTYLLYGTRFCAIEHTLCDNKERLYAAILKKNKNTVVIDNCYAEDSLEQLIPKLSKKQHIVLVINNDQVLTKKFEGTSTNPLKAVYKAFPNININDFYYEVLEQKDSVFVSICRKSYGHELIERYRKLGFQIIALSLGNSITSTVTGFIETDTFCSSNALITIKDGNITSIEQQDVGANTYMINGLNVSNRQLLPFAGALDQIRNQYHPTTNIGPVQQHLKSDYSQSRWFTLLLKSGLVFILMLLFVNFFLFNHYYTVVNNLRQTLQVNETSKQQLVQLSESVAQSEKTVNDILKSSSSKSSFYVNDVIKSLPEPILLSELNFQPLLKRIKEDQPITVDDFIILVSGTSNNSALFSKWLTTLEAFDWIKTVKIVNYSDNKTETSNFSIKITLDHG